MKVRLLGSYTLDPLAQALRRARPDLEVEVAPYGQFRQAAHVPGPGRTDVLVTDLDAWIPGGASGLLALSPGRRRELREGLAREVAALAEASTGAGGRMLFATLPAPVRPLLGYADWQEPEGEAAWIHAANLAVSEALRSRPACRIWDLGGLRAAFGALASEDPRLRFLGDLRMSPAFAEAAAADLARLLRAWASGPRKVLALDLDGTLWGGLVGEEGLSVSVGKEDPVGRAFLAFQERALSLKRRGVLLAVVSKNDEAAALEVLEGHPGSLIRKSDLAGWRINWEDKASNLRALAADLGLGLDSFAFWDDQPFEREWVRKACPEVAVAEVPPDPSRHADALAAWDAFDGTAVTEEDRARPAQYVTERARRDLKSAAGSMDEYLRALETRVTIAPPSSADLTRLAQLFQRTNQFNLTTRRLDEAALRALLSRPDARLLSMRLSDRFGDQGLVGAAALESGPVRITDFLLSCRVLGRKAETALLAACVEEARRLGARELLGEFLPTPKNGMCRGFYADAGFSPAGGGAFRLPLDGSVPVPAVPPWIRAG